MLFTDEKLNAMVKVADTIKANPKDQATMNKVIEYVNSMHYSKAKCYLESVLITWVKLHRPGTAFKLCVNLAFEIAQDVDIPESEQDNYKLLECLANFKFK